MTPLDKTVEWAELVYPVLYLCLATFWWRSFPPRRVERQYSLMVKGLWLLPFSDRWRAGISPERIDMIGRFRGRFFICLTVPLVVGLLQSLYYSFVFSGLHALR